MKGGVFSRLLRYARPYWALVAVALGLMLVNSGIQIAGPAITKVAIDKYLVPTTDRQPHWVEAHLPDDRFDGVGVLSLAFFAALLVGMATAVAQSYVMQRTGQLVMFDLRRDLHRHLQRLDLAYFDRHPVGSILTRLTSDVDAVNEMLSSGIVAVLGDIFVLAFLLAAMVRLSPGMTLVLLAIAPLIALAAISFRNASRESNRRIRAAVAQINTTLQEHIGGVSVLQLFNRERQSEAEMDKANREHMDAFKDAIHAYGWFYPVVEFLGVLALGGLLVFGGFQVQRGEITVGALVAFLQFSLRFFRPLQDLSEKFGTVQQATAAGERIFQLLDTKREIGPPPRPEPVPIDTTVEFDHVWFAYKGEDWVIRDLSFRIEPGEMIAVVGHTGAGKTTLSSLLLRFYEPQRGTIRVGGIDIRQLDPSELRRRFAVVLQDPFLFTGDIAGNIRLDTDGIGDQALRDAAARVNLGEFIDALPGGFAHPVRERGAGLSTGQKQLISFARALAHNPSFLILDEATSSVDTETELRVRAALGELLTGRTSLVVAHRLSTIQRADRIFVMHKGELRESGSHQQLLGERGIYWKLYQLQYKDQELPVSPVSGGSTRPQG
jgi:ATP-binding cassette subfamily B protein